MTNKDKFFEVFGVDVWDQMIVFAGLDTQFEEYWKSPYSEVVYSCCTNKEIQEAINE